MEKEQDLFALAINGDISILSHPDVARKKNMYGNTPLHYLAELKAEALKHPDAHKVENNMRLTPLHVAAYLGIPEVLHHPNVATSDVGFTPLQIAALYLSPDLVEITFTKGLSGGDKYFPVTLGKHTDNAGTKILHPHREWH